MDFGPGVFSGVAVGKIERFEDLEVWQKSRELARLVYRITAKPTFERDWSLRSQLRDAAVSTAGNIAEGFERGGNKEFLQFLAISKGSSGEVRSHLYVALDKRYITEAEHHRLHDKALEVRRMVSGLMKHLRQSPLRGSKYK